VNSFSYYSHLFVFYKSLGIKRQPKSLSKCCKLQCPTPHDNTQRSRTWLPPVAIKDVQQMGPRSRLASSRRIWVDCTSKTRPTPNGVNTSVNLRWGKTNSLSRQCRSEVKSSRALRGCCRTRTSRGAGNSQYAIVALNRKIDSAIFRTIALTAAVGWRAINGHVACVATVKDVAEVI
jgi:hypothetical protein